MIREYARAKINLFLEITGKRPDGYHDLVTVMQTVSLSDAMTFEMSSVPGVHLTVNGNVPAGGRIWSAVRQMRFLPPSARRSAWMLPCKKTFRFPPGLAGGVRTRRQRCAR